ncbi:MAG: hypothetical protein QM770_17090 [Tepidisphaeraceae bacterium]
MPLGEWFSKFKPVVRGVTDASAAPEASTRRDADPAAPVAALREAVEQLRGRTNELAAQLELTTRRLEAFTAPDAAQLQALNQQVDGLKLQHESTVAAFHELGQQTRDHRTQVEHLSARFAGVDHVAKAFEGIDPHELKEQIATGAKARIEIDNRLTEITNVIRKLQNNVTGVLQSAEVAREAYLARDNARIAESQRDRKTLWALVGIAMLLSAAAFLVAMKALGHQQ